MKAVWAMLYTTFRTLSRYPTQYLSGSVGPFLWAIPTLLLIQYANRSGLENGFTNATGLDPRLALSYLFIGGLYWNYVEGVWSVALSVRQNFLAGTLEALWVTQASRISLIMGWSLGRLIGITANSAVAVVILVILTPPLPIVSWLSAIVVLVISLMAAYGFAFFLAGLSLRYKDDGSIVSMLGNAAPLLGGVIFPITMLPLPIRVLGYAFPFTYGADVIRGLIVGSRTLIPFPWEMALIIAMGILLPIIGWISFVRLEQRARSAGLGGF